MDNEKDIIQDGGVSNNGSISAVSAEDTSVSAAIYMPEEGYTADYITDNRDGTVSAVIDGTTYTGTAEKSKPATDASGFVATGFDADTASGGIYNSVKLNISEAVFYNNAANQGGVASSITEVTVSNSKFYSNTATQQGGVLYTWNTTGLITFSNSIFEGNTSGTYGGVIAVGAYASVAVDGGSFSNNTAKGGNGGGAIYYKSTKKEFSLTVDNSTEFINNTAKNGGAIYIENATIGTVTIAGAVFGGNTSTTEGSGAIYNRGTKSSVSNISLLTSSDTVNNNTGGTISFFGKNIINADITNSGGTVNVYNADGEADENGTPAYKATEFVFHDYSQWQNYESSVTAQWAKGSITVDKALAGAKSLTFNIDSNAYIVKFSATQEVAGDVFINAGVLTADTFVTVADKFLDAEDVKSYQVNGAAVTWNSACTLGTATDATGKNYLVAKNGSALKLAEASREYTLTDRAIVNGTALGGFYTVTVGDTTYISASTASSVGGTGSVENLIANDTGLYIGGSASVTYKNVIFSNFASSTNAQMRISSADRDVTLEGVQFYGCVNGKDGGAVNISDVKNFVIQGDTPTEFLNNSGNNGGAFIVANIIPDNVSIDGAIYRNNSAAVSGGAVYNAVNASIANADITSGTVVTKINNAEFTSNTAVTDGGAVYNRGLIEISNADFFNNTAVRGGAIYNSKVAAVKNINLWTVNDDIYNTGVLHLTGQNTVNADIANTGTVNVYAADTEADGATYKASAFVFHDYTHDLCANMDSSLKGDITVDKALAGAASLTFNVKNGYKVNFSGAEEVVGNVTVDAGLNSLAPAYSTVIASKFKDDDVTASQTYTVDGKSVTWDGNTGSIDGNTTYQLTKVDGGGDLAIELKNAAFFVTDGDPQTGLISMSAGGAVYNGIGTSATFAGATAARSAAGLTDAPVIAYDSTWDTNVTNNSGTLIFTGSNTLNAVLTNSGNGTLKLEDAVLTGGSGSRIVGNGIIAINGNSKISNFSTTADGAVRANASLSIDGSAVFSGNSAKNGGAVFVGNYTAVTSASISGTFENNAANSNGGAVYNDVSGVKVQIADAVFELNTATENGGAIYNAANAKMSITGVKFTSNSAKNGGAVSNHGSLTLDNAEFKDNTAANTTSGAIYNLGVLTVANSKFLTANDAIYNKYSSAFENKLILAGGNIFNGSITNDANGIAHLFFAGENTVNANVANSNTGTITVFATDAEAEAALGAGYKASAFVFHDYTDAPVDSTLISDITVDGVLAGAASLTFNAGDYSVRFKGTAAVDINANVTINAADVSKGQLYTIATNVTDADKKTYTIGEETVTWTDNVGTVGNYKLYYQDNTLYLTARTVNVYGAEEFKSMAKSDTVTDITLASADDFKSLAANGKNLTITGEVKSQEAKNGYNFYGGGVNSDQSATGNVTIESEASVNFYAVCGGGYYTQGNSLNNPLKGDSRITVDGDVTTTRLLGGGQATYGSNSTVYVVGNSELVINGNVSIGEEYKEISGGSTAVVCGGWQAGGLARVTVSGSSSVEINGGIINGFVSGGGFLMKDTSSLTQERDDGVTITSVTVNGGTINGHIIGGIMANTRDTIKEVESQGVNSLIDAKSNENQATSITIDATVNEVTIGEGYNIYAGSFGKGIVTGKTSVTFKGIGSNLTFTGKVSGANSSATADDIRVSGTKNLVFDGFTGDFGASEIVFMDTVTFTDSAVNFTNTASKLDFADVSSWNFNISDSDQKQTIAGDNTVVFTEGDKLNVNWTGSATGEFEIFSGNTANLTSMTITFGEQGGIWDSAKTVFTSDDSKYTLTVADNSLTLGIA